MKLAKRIILITLTIIICMMIFMVSSPRSLCIAHAHELEQPKYCYTNKDSIEIYSNKETLDIRAIASINLTLIKTYDDGHWSYVYYNNGELSGWIPSWDVTDGCGQGGNVWIKKFEPIGRLKCTGYTPSPKENGGTGLTCTGIRASTVVGQCVAANLKFLPLDTKLYIKGIGYRTVMDTGVRGKTLDVLVNTNREAYALTGYYDVYIVK